MEANEDTSSICQYSVHRVHASGPTVANRGIIGLSRTTRTAFASLVRRIYSRPQPDTTQPRAKSLHPSPEPSRTADPFPGSTCHRPTALSASRRSADCRRTAAPSGPRSGTASPRCSPSASPSRCRTHIARAATRGRASLISSWTSEVALERAGPLVVLRVTWLDRNRPRRGPEQEPDRSWRLSLGAEAG